MAISEHDAPATDHLDGLGPAPWPTLPGTDYHAADVFDLERERVFARSWVCVGRAEQLPEAGDYLVAEVADESPIVLRGDDGALRAFANACRHRGTELLTGAGSTGRVIKCPYHAWTYSLDGRLVGSPNVGAADGIDRDSMGLWAVPIAEHDGFVFLNLDPGAEPLHDALAAQPDSLLELARYGLGELRVGARREYDVHANWKIVVENYHECLHCPTVHPELVKIVPLYRAGEVEEDGQLLGNSMGEGLTSFTFSGTSSLPTLPGIDEVDVRTFYGVYVFPNLIVNYHSDSVNVVRLIPVGSRSHPGGERVPAAARDDRGRRVRRARAGRVPRRGREPGLARVRGRATRRLLALLHGRRVPAAGTMDQERSTSATWRREVRFPP